MHDSAEMHLQVELAQSEYQLPRLTRMWTHLERQAGGRVRGMGEKQIEVDKRILRTRMGQLRRNLEDVRAHRKQYRVRRAEVRLFQQSYPKLVPSALVPVLASPTTYWLLCSNQTCSCSVSHSWISHAAVPQNLDVVASVHIMGLRYVSNSTVCCPWRAQGHFDICPCSSDEALQCHVMLFL